MASSPISATRPPAIESTIALPIDLDVNALPWSVSACAALNSAASAAQSELRASAQIDARAVSSVAGFDTKPPSGPTKNAPHHFSR